MNNPDWADLRYAAQIASVLLASIPTQPHAPDTFVRQLASSLVGRRKDDLQSLVNPTGGFLNKVEFVNIASVARFLDELEERRAERVSYHPEHHRFLPAPEGEQVSPEERERRYRMLKATAQVIKDTVKANCVGRPSVPAPKQAHNPDRLMAAMANLDALKSDEGGDAELVA